MSDTVVYILLPVVGWLAKEVIELRPVKENLEHIRTRVDEIYSHFIISGPEKGRRDEEPPV